MKIIALVPIEEIVDRLGLPENTSITMVSLDHQHHAVQFDLSAPVRLELDPSKGWIGTPEAKPDP